MEYMKRMIVPFYGYVHMTDPVTTYHYTFMVGNQPLYTIVIYDAMEYEEAKDNLTQSLQDALLITNEATVHYGIKLTV